ncbi:hypothetical protein [Streptomyces erythrochromogenes]|uniref:hypothetical protein n=1 Tax=Streptomyces erythrochromogenes TaxID=285574 RepID=UPI00030CDA16
MSTNAKSFEERAASEPTDLHKAFAHWIEMETGVKPDLKTVQLVCSLRMDFQKSETNQADLAKRKKAAADKKAKAAAEKRERLQKQLAKLQAELAETAEVEPAVSVPAETAAPAQAAAPTLPVKRAPARKRPTSARPAAK